MKFPYSTGVFESADSDDFYLVRRPEIPVTIIGENGSATVLALVDTGSDSTIFPLSVADHLGIEVEHDSTPLARSFAGHQVSLLSGVAFLEIESGDEPLRWQAPVCFFDFDSPDQETAVLGHEGFLEFFTAIFDGKACELTLEANDELTVEKE